MVPVFKEKNVEENINFEEINNLKVFVIDDEFEVRENIHSYLSKFNVQVFDSENGDNVLKKLKEIMPDVLLVDNRLGKKTSGIDIISEVRSCPIFNGLPIIMLTGFPEEREEIRAFETGVDDFLEKPFYTHELVLRIKALVKRKKQQLGLKISYEDLEVCLKTYQSFYRKINLNLSKTESIILSILLKNINSLTTKEVIIGQFGRKMRIRTLDVHMVHIRNAFKKHNIQPIESVKYLGYCLKI